MHDAHPGPQQYEVDISKIASKKDFSSKFKDVIIVIVGIQVSSIFGSKVPNCKDLKNDK